MNNSLASFSITENSLVILTGEYDPKFKNYINIIIFLLVKNNL